MKRFNNHLIMTAALVMLAVIGTLMNSHQSVLQGAGGPTVTIDPTQLPLPVIGKVGITGTPTINFSNTASTPLFTRDIDGAARQPFQTSLCEYAAFGANPTVCAVPDNYAVPSNRRLVIEYVSATCLAGPIGGTGLTSLGVRLLTTAGGTPAQHIFPLSFGLGEVDLAQQTRIYADPGTSVYFYFTQAGGGVTPSSVICNGALSGYTITKP